MFWDRGVGVAFGDGFTRSQGGGTAKNNQVEQGIRSESIGAVDGDAGRFANGHQSWYRSCFAVAEGLDFGLEIGRNPAHVVMNRWEDRHRLLMDVNARKDSCGFSDSREPFINNRPVDMLQVEMDIVAIWATASAFLNLDSDRPAHDVP